MSLANFALEAVRHIVGYVHLLGKFYFRFMRAKDRLMMSLAKTLKVFKGLLFPSLTLKVYPGCTLAEPT